MPATPTAVHRLNPLTKAVIATVASVGAFVLGGYVGPLLIVAAMLALAAAARVLGSLVRASLLLSLPIAVSVVLVSVFTRAGTTVLFQIGPFDATAEGVDFVAQTLSLPDQLRWAAQWGPVSRGCGCKHPGCRSCSRWSPRPSR